MTKTLPIGAGLAAPVAPVGPGDLRSEPVAGEAGDLGPGVERDARRGVDPLDQVVGHGGGEAVGTHEDVHVGRGAGQEDRRLARRVAAADDDHLLGGTELGLHGGGGVVDALALEALVVRHVERR